LDCAFSWCTAHHATTLTYEDPFRVDLIYAGIVALHRMGSRLILAVTVAHGLALVLHDWRGRRSEISAMMNGEKVFEIERPRPLPGPGAAPGPSFRVEDIRR
jgi:hypothetical protein